MTFAKWVAQQIKKDGTIQNPIRQGATQVAYWQVKFGPFRLRGRVEFSIAHTTTPEAAKAYSDLFRSLCEQSAVGGES